MPQAGDWGLGTGDWDWGLGIGDWGLGWGLGFWFEAINEIDDRGSVQLAEAVRHARGNDDDVFRPDVFRIAALVRAGLARSGVEPREIHRRRIVERAAGDDRAGPFRDLINLGDAIVNQCRR